MGLDIDFYYVKQRGLGRFRKYYLLASYFENLYFDEEDINGKDIELSYSYVNTLYSNCIRVPKNHDLATKYFPGNENFSSEDYDEAFFQELEEIASYISDEIMMKFNKLDVNGKIVVNVNW